MLEGVFHFALWSSEGDGIETDQEKRMNLEGGDRGEHVRNRSGTSIISKMKEKSVELNNEQQVSFVNRSLRRFTV